MVIPSKKAFEKYKPRGLFSEFYGIHVTNLEMHTTRIFEVKIPVVYSEMHRTRIFAVKIRVANFEIEQPDFCSENPSCKCKL